MKIQILYSKKLYFTFSNSSFRSSILLAYSSGVSEMGEDNSGVSMPVPSDVGVDTLSNVVPAEIFKNALYHNIIYDDKHNDINVMLVQ